MTSPPDQPATPRPDAGSPSPRSKRGEIPDAPPVRPTDAPYASSYEHVCDEMRRIEMLIRAQTRRWHETVAASKPQQSWGMVHVTDAEVDAYLATPFTPPHQLPEFLERLLASYWAAVEDLARTIDARRAKTPATVPLRLDGLAATFCLSPLERDALLISIIPELDARYRRLFAYLQDDASRTRPTVELILQMLHPVARQQRQQQPERHLVLARAVFDGASPLVANRLVVVAENDEPLPMRSVRADERTTAYLFGGDAPDARVHDVISLASPLSWSDLVGNERQLPQLQHLLEWWIVRRPHAATGAVFLLHGAYGSGRSLAARAFCGELRTPLLIADVDAALRATCGWDQAIELCDREARLNGAAIYWRRCELLLDREQPAHRWERLLAIAERFPGLTFLGSQSSWDAKDRFRRTPFMRIDFQAPDFAARRKIWTAHLPPPIAMAAESPPRETIGDLLANAFQLTGGQIVDAITTALSQAASREPLRPRVTLQDLYDGCRRQSSRSLSAFARRIEPRTELTFDDLILPEANARQIRELRARIRNRNLVSSGLGFERRITIGRGLIVMFTGSSGTGKTMAAELLAREQGVDLYKVDLSAVVSKWVGETEKNLSRVFSEAEDTNAMIFFDEADALFGKRGEVKDAQDRWANMETNYLLQRVEEYSGVVILASNLRQNIDEAFVRRIQVIVEFPFPDVSARAQILAALFPASMDRPSAAELRQIAERFPLSGGSLKNVVLDAMFRSLAQRGDAPPVITLRHLVVAVAREYQKAGKPITRGEFGVEFHRWVEEDIL